MHKELIKKAEDIICQRSGEGSYCTLSLIDRNGYPAASTITVSKVDGIRKLAFGTGLSSNKVNRIGNTNMASVCFNSDSYSITLLGKIEVSTDPQIKRKMWYRGLENHFSGPEDPSFCVLLFTTEQYSLFIDWQEARGAL